MTPSHPAPEPPFAALASEALPQEARRAAITAACRRPEPDCVAPLLAAAPAPEERAEAATLAQHLVTALRAKPQPSGVAALVQEFALSSQEGVALMCLAEALLRIPDTATRDALIRDKIGHGDWAAHLGLGRSLFVNAATWGLMVTGRLAAAEDETGLGAALARLVARGGEPVIRRGMDLAMRMMGEQFVTGETIAEALSNARRQEAKGFRHSYDMLGEAALQRSAANEARGYGHSFDMLGEAALTEADARRYADAYAQAIHAIGRASGGRGPVAGPGISIKLSALHPRYQRSQRERVSSELLARLKALLLLAKGYDIGVNIDAEEADRLELSLDLLEALAGDPELAGWHGLGFVVQAYQKRCPALIDALIDLARRSRRRLMIRLVKGAYWDSEIKRAQELGLAAFPVWTYKDHTDLAYLACAARLFEAAPLIYPQFATHNALTIGAILTMAGKARARLPKTAGVEPFFELQRLHGMGDGIYRDILDDPEIHCRVYAPVGQHRDLLAYLVRRLLENGANSSFVNQLHDDTVPIEQLLLPPAPQLALDPAGGGGASPGHAGFTRPAGHAQPAGPGRPRGAPTPASAVTLPMDLFAPRRNSAGVDLSDARALAPLVEAATRLVDWTTRRPDELAADTVDVVMQRLARGQRAWDAPDADDRVEKRARTLERAADLLQDRTSAFCALLVREAGKTYGDAVSEVREAIDFLRYYAGRARLDLAPDDLPGPTGETNTLTLGGRGVFVAISPWNFPLAIFTGQVAAALAAGNAVAAKPAEQTPLIAAAMVDLLHEAGVAIDALALVPGPGETVGATLVADPRCAGVVFTGSTPVAKAINRALADGDGPIRPLIAETGGLNAMIVDSSALPEQVCDAVIGSAFRSAGQRCSALRVLCLHESIADAMIEMIEGAMATLAVGDPLDPATDVGPLIDRAAADEVRRQIGVATANGRLVTGGAGQPPALTGDLDAALDRARFIAPTLIEIDELESVREEIFGPVLQVCRWRGDPVRLIERINGLGYGLTLGLQSRVDSRVQALARQARVGNVYINRNVIGAVVGSQPFGGEALSGTGPKAGGPHYLPRFCREQTITINTAAAGGNAELLAGGRT